MDPNKRTVSVDKSLSPLLIYVIEPTYKALEIDLVSRYHCGRLEPAFRFRIWLWILLFQFKALAA